MTWVINPELDTVSILEQYGRFLENDYRMIIEHLEVPKDFEEYVEKTERKFVIIGSRDTPWMLAKSVFLCLKLAGPISVVVKTPNVDESFMVQNVFDYHAGDVRTKLYTDIDNCMQLDQEWLEEIENATDIIVFGNKNTMETYRDYESVDRRVWEHGYKFSFGIIREEHLTPTIINQICFDFFSFYGEGTLAPKFYFVIGKIKKKHAKQFSQNMAALYEGFIDGYREKINFSQRSELINGMLSSIYISKSVRLDSLNSESIFDNLYGDVKLVEVRDYDEITDFISEWHDNISTIAINSDDDVESLYLLEDMMVMRICEVGYMQFPDFFDQFDSVDDFNIYTDEEDIGDPFEDGFI